MAEIDFRAARRYAAALFATAEKAGAVDRIEADMQAVAESLETSPRLLRLWESPLLDASRKKDMIEAVYGSSIDAHSKDFLTLLVDKRREALVPGVNREFGRLADESRKMVRAEAIFAVQPTDEETRGLAASLQQRTGEQVELSVRVDPSLLGGVIVRMHDKVIDGSVRGTLEQLRERLLQEA